MESKTENKTAGESKDSAEESQTEKDEAVLKQIYYNYENPAALSTLKKLRKEVKKKTSKIDEKAMQDFLLSQKVYSLYKPRKTKFARRFIWLKKKFSLICSDLADFQRLKNFNRGYSWIMVNTCAVTNLMFLVPLKKKNTENMINGFEQLLAWAKSFDSKIQRIWSDEGNLWGREMRV